MLRVSQTSLADALGVTFQQVQKYERGSNRVSASTLVRIGDKLGMSVGELVGEDDRQPSQRSEVFRSLNDVGSHDLLQAFGKIGDPATRRAIVVMVKAVARQKA